MDPLKLGVELLQAFGDRDPVRVPEEVVVCVEEVVAHALPVALPPLGVMVRVTVALTRAEVDPELHPLLDPLLEGEEVTLIEALPHPVPVLDLLPLPDTVPFKPPAVPDAKPVVEEDLLGLPVTDTDLEGERVLDTEGVKVGDRVEDRLPPPLALADLERVGLPLPEAHLLVVDEAEGDLEAREDLEAEALLVEEPQLEGGTLEVGVAVKHRVVERLRLPEFVRVGSRLEGEVESEPVKVPQPEGEVVVDMEMEGVGVLLRDGNLEAEGLLEGREVLLSDLLTEGEREVQGEGVKEGVTLPLEDTVLVLLAAPERVEHRLGEPLPQVVGVMEEEGLNETLLDGVTLGLADWVVEVQGEALRLVMPLGVWVRESVGVTVRVGVETRE